MRSGWGWRCSFCTALAEPVTGQHDCLIVSNPPYVAAADPHLAALRHEPLQALASGPDGLDDIRTIMARRPAIWRRADGCCWNMATTRRQPVRALLPVQGFARSAAATTWPALNAALAAGPLQNGDFATANGK
jgi:methylase of polypeptide subunit release factors